MKCARLLCGRDPAESPLATLLLAAIAAMSGLTAEGEQQPRAKTSWLEVRVTVAELVTETGADPRAARRALDELVAAGVITLAAGPRGRAEARIVCPALLAARWGVVRRRVAFDQALRQARLAPPYALLAAWVDGQTRAAHPVVRTTRGSVASMLGLTVHMVRRALAAADGSGVIGRTVHDDRLVLWSTRDRCRSAPPTGAILHHPRGRSAPVQDCLRTGADLHPHRGGSATPPVQICPSTGADLHHATPSPRLPRLPRRARAPAREAAAAPAEAEPERLTAAAVELAEAIRASGYRSRTPRKWRDLAIDRRARELAAEGLTVAGFAALVAAAARESMGDPDALLAVWIDGRLWSAVLADLEQAQRARRATGRPEGEPKLAASTLDDALPARRSQT
ncbi:MAG: hypothetical protein KDE27_19395 [Planctomycetes bacterium]|nr:hypothetical protein [Planctomycetota bacterium]